MHPNFGWVPFHKHFKKFFPAANVHNLNEWFTIGTFFPDTPAHDNGIFGHDCGTMLQLFAGKESSFFTGNPMREEGLMPNTF